MLSPKPQADNQNIDTSRVLPAGVLGNMGKSGDVCNVIFGRPAVFSRLKNVHYWKHCELLE